MATHHELSNFIWQIADLLRGPYRPPQYERVMLPMTVLRRFDCVLAPTKEKVLREHEKRKGGKLNDDALDKFLNRAAGQRFHNHSPLTFEKLKGDPDHIDKHLTSYINGFSANVRQIFDYFEFTNEIEKMREANILYLVVSKFCDADLHPDNLDNLEMGLLFENLIRRFNELANETAGDHFTPREVIRLMVNLLFINDDKLLATPGTVRKLLDPTCGTGGMLAESQNYLREHHPDAKLYVYGQDYNKRAFAVAASDMLIKEVDHNGTVENIRFGDTFTDDQFPGETFDYFLTNPPFGVDWKKQAADIEKEHDKLGHSGRFGAGLPRVNDGALLFLQHMVSKFEPVQPEQHKHGSRLAIVFNGSPLFTGGAGSGESDIRKWIIENDWLEAVVALPEQMFYNTGIGTYIWIVANRKEKRRKGKIQLVDAREFYVPMRRSLGDKRRKIGEGKDGEPDQIADIVRLFGRFEGNERSKIFDNEDFGYTRVTVERPLRLRLELNADEETKWLNAVEEAHQKDKERMAAPAELKAWFAEILAEFGRKAWMDWNVIADRIGPHLKRLGGLGKDAEREFRRFFVLTDPKAQPIISKSEPLKKGETVSEADRFSGWFEVKDAEGNRARLRYVVDGELRDFENVPLKQDVDDYFRREVLPHVSDAWMDRSKDKVGYEINFNRHFYRYTPPRPLEAIDADLKTAEEEIFRLLKEVTA
jgi:type I restriction enzyme M protein